MATSHQANILGPKVSGIPKWRTMEVEMIELQPDPVFCVACEFMFPDHSSWEDHECPAVMFICSCGMDFKDYSWMLIHRDGHKETSAFQFDVASIIRCKEEEARLRSRRLQLLQKLGRKLRPGATSSSASRPLSNVHRSIPSFSATSFPPFKGKAVLAKHSNAPSTPTLQTAPQSKGFVNLTRRFQPVVIVETTEAFRKRGKFMCKSCGVTCTDKYVLFSHFAAHFPTYIYGCLRCGMLEQCISIPSKHVCGEYVASQRDKFTFGRCLKGDAFRSTAVRCPYCPSVFFKSWHITLHIQNMHKGLLSTPPQSVKIQAPTPLSSAYPKVANVSVVPPGKTPDVIGWTPLNGIFTPKPIVPVNTLGTSKTLLHSSKVATQVSNSAPKGRGRTDVRSPGPRKPQCFGSRSLAEQRTSLRCALCGKGMNGVQMLRQHRCQQRLVMLRPDQLPTIGPKRTTDETGLSGASLCPAPVKKETDSAWMLTLQASHDPKECEPLFKTIQVEPSEENCSALFKSVAVQTKVEWNDGSYDMAEQSSSAASIPALV